MTTIIQEIIQSERKPKEKVALLTEKIGRFWRRDMDEKEINKFLIHLEVNEHLSASTQIQALCVIVFL